MEKEVFVNSLKPGDEIFIISVGRSFARDEETIYRATVDAVHVKHVIVSSIRRDLSYLQSKKFRKDNLEETGRKFGRMHMGDPHYEILEANAENKEKYRVQTIQNFCAKTSKQLSEIKWKGIEVQQLEQLTSLLRPIYTLLNPKSCDQSRPFGMVGARGESADSPAGSVSEETRKEDKS